MRIVLVNRFYGGPQIPTGRMLQDVAWRLDAEGHEVTVFTSSGRYDGASASGRCSEGGARVRVVHAAVPARLPRAAAWLWFTWQVRRCIPRMEWDVCVLMTDPPLLPLLAATARGRGTGDGRQRAERQVAVWLMDLYPEALVASGRLGARNPICTWYFRRRQRALASADLLICLGDAQKARLGTELTGRVSTAVVPPWDERPDIVTARDDGLRDMALYAGNLGEAHNFGPLLAAAPHLPASWTIRFAVRGAKEEALRRAVGGAAGAGARIEVTGYVGEDETSALLGSARVHLITMAEGWEGIVVPSKLYGCVRTGRPVLFIGPEDADTAREIRRHGWGECLPGRADGRAVAAAMLELAARATSAPAVADGAAEVAAAIAGLAD